jgi:YidC/Oxa1 family membrane protein insertase
MDNQRLILFVALSLILYMGWQAWQKDYGPQQVAATSSAVEPATAPAEAPKDVPAAQETKADATAVQAETETPQAPQQEKLESSQRILVTTDTLRVIIDTRGGDIREADLLKYPVSLDKPDEPFRLMKDSLPNLFVAQSGLLSNGKAPDHYAVFKAEKKQYTLAPGMQELRVPLTWEDSGIKVTKTLVFHRGTDVIDIDQRVENDSAEPWQGRQYRQLQRSKPDKSGKSRFIYTYNGGVIYSPEEHYEKRKFDDMADNKLSRDITGGWAAMIQHYFLAAIIPGADETNHFYSKVTDSDRYILGMVSASKTIEPGKADTFSTRLYVGPKTQGVLKKLAEGLDLTVDYGVLTVIAKPLFWVLGWFHGLFGNWGWAILMVTLIIKLAFFPLSAASYRSMANMRKFAPKMQQLKERYGDDRQKMSQAMMELYKKEKINPLGGCLPMIVQIPVFISLYWVLLESVELRQAPFIFWITDLSIKDPYYVLPLLMGVSMFTQQKLNPPPPDPVQAKVMMALPIIFTLFFAFFPSGLVLYWLANSVLSVTQQWYITRKIEKAAAAK